MEAREQLLTISLKEYEILKAEQTRRVGLRNNLIYVTLGLFTGIVSFAFVNSYILLILPWICLILGWTYLTNDQQIAAISRYIRIGLVERISRTISYEDIESILGFEIAHRSDKRRKRRKIEQLIIDEITFVISGILALSISWLLIPQLTLGIKLLIVIELLLLLTLGIEIIINADLGKGR